MSEVPLHLIHSRKWRTLSSCGAVSGCTSHGRFWSRTPGKTATPRKIRGVLLCTSLHFITQLSKFGLHMCKDKDPMCGPTQRPDLCRTRFWSRTPGSQLLSRNVERLRGMLVFKAHRFLHHSTLGSGVIKKKKDHERRYHESCFTNAHV